MSDRHPPDDEAVEAQDDVLLAELRAAVSAKDPVPARLIESAGAAYSWRTIDEELAQLQFDSLAEATAVRSVDSAIHLSYGASETWIEIDVTDDAILGQVEPPADEVRLVFGSGNHLAAACDEFGQFRFERPPSGPVRLVAYLQGREVATEWFTI